MARWRLQSTTAWVQRIRATGRVPFLQVVKTSVAAVAAWFAADLLIAQVPPIFAVIAALIVVQPSVNQSLGRALERSIGVIVGVVLATGISLLFGSAAWIILVAVVLSILLAWALRLSQQTSNQIPISAMLVLALGAASPIYAIDRIAETVLGAAIAFVVNLLIVPPVLLEPARREVRELAEEIARSLERLAVAASEPVGRSALEGHLVEVRLLRPMLARAQVAVATAEDSLALNWRGHRHRGELAGYDDALVSLGVLVTRVAGMTRTMRDHYDDSLHHEAVMRQIAAELRRAAHDLRIRFVLDAPDDASDTGPLLTAPLVVVSPHPDHWIVIGSMLEDLRRVHEELTAD
ncbi:hypothetical protein GCM10009846_28040 [Agrococcus versicolor]|uniref:FUSC family protein n=1 Tax=Agrococcus versicolor TaxID=501482 RepID=A0ABN3AXC5_9MICO